MSNKSSLDYVRMKNVREDLRYPNLPDLQETSHPRYQMGNALSHRRGQLRMEKWLKYKKQQVDA